MLLGSLSTIQSDDLQALLGDCVVSQQWVPNFISVAAEGVGNFASAVFRPHTSSRLLATAGPILHLGAARRRWPHDAPSRRAGSSWRGADYDDDCNDSDDQRLTSPSRRRG